MRNLYQRSMEAACTVGAGIFAGKFSLACAPFIGTNPLLVFAVPFAGLLFVLLLVNLQGVVLAVLFFRALLDPLLNMTRIDVMGQDIGAGALINLAVLMVAGIMFLRRPELAAREPFFFRWLMFLILAGCAVLYAPDSGRGIRTFLNLASYAGMSLIPFLVTETRDRLRFWIRALFWSTVLPVMFANLDLLCGGKMSHDAGIRIQGTFTHPNILAFFLVFTIILVFYVVTNALFRLTPGRRLIIGIYFANLLFLLIATKTRSAWAACWAFFFIYGLLHDRRILFVVLAAPFAMLLNPEMRERALDVSTRTSVGVGDELDSFAWRLKLWSSSLPLIRTRWFMGYGLASFGSMAQSFFKVDSIVRQNIPSHNSYLEILFETGIGGLIAWFSLFSFMIGTFWKRFLRASSSAGNEFVIVLASIVSYLMVCFSDNLLYYLSFNWYFWFFIGIMLKRVRFDDAIVSKGFYYRSVV
jgi:O-antigen ligase